MPQPALDALMARFPNGRCFVRPSGTEDVVRTSHSEAAMLRTLHTRHALHVLHVLHALHASRGLHALLTLQVRVYAEAATQAQADELALLTAQATHELAGGVGDAPTKAVS